MIHKPNEKQAENLIKFIPIGAKLIGFYYVDNETLRVWFKLQDGKKDAKLLSISATESSLG
jgi:hypothetical protein